MRKHTKATQAERAVAREIVRHIVQMIDTQTALVARCEQLHWKGPRVKDLEKQLADLDNDLHHAELARAQVLRMTTRTKPSAA